MFKRAALLGMLVVVAQVRADMPVDMTTAKLHEIIAHQNVVVKQIEAFNTKHGPAIDRMREALLALQKPAASAEKDPKLALKEDIAVAQAKLRGLLDLKKMHDNMEMQNLVDFKPEVGFLTQIHRFKNGKDEGKVDGLNTEPELVRNSAGLVMTAIERLDAAVQAKKVVLDPTLPSRATTRKDASSFTAIAKAAVDTKMAAISCPTHAVLTAEATALSNQVTAEKVALAKIRDEEVKLAAEVKKAANETAKLEKDFSDEVAKAFKVVIEPADVKLYRKVGDKVVEVPASIVQEFLLTTLSILEFNSSADVKKALTEEFKGFQTSLEQVALAENKQGPKLVSFSVVDEVALSEFVERYKAPRDLFKTRIEARRIDATVQNQKLAALKTTNDGLVATKQALITRLESDLAVISPCAVDRQKADATVHALPLDLMDPSALKAAHGVFTDVQTRFEKVRPPAKK